MLTSFDRFSELTGDVQTLIVFSDRHVLINKVTEQLPVLTTAIGERIEAAGCRIYRLNELDAQPSNYWVVDAEGGTLELDDCDYVSLRQVMMTTDHSPFMTVGRAWQLAYFHRTHRFCGVCGTPTEHASDDFAIVCPNCGHRNYPRVSPCIIVAIYRDNEILLAQSARHQSTGMYSTIAGFVESGESLEHAVEREIMEEVGVEVDNIAYFSSQPWPFPHALMVGYTARWKARDIALHDEEISDAAWFSLDDLPFVPPRFSIAGQLIAHVKNNLAQK